MEDPAKMNDPDCMDSFQVAPGPQNLSNGHMSLRLQVPAIVSSGSFFSARLCSQL